MPILLLAAYASYIFHEFGHWLFGTLMGYEMVMSLNNTWLRSGSFLKESHSLYFVIGGPAFTILQAMLALAVIEKCKGLFAYPFLLFPLVLRMLSWTLGNFSMQDEAVISTMLGLKIHIVAIVVGLILLALVWRGSRTLELNFKTNSLLFLCSVAFSLMVMATNRLFFP
jgi:hypothetical protein